MKFCWTTLHVKNLESSLSFYEQIVGLKVNRRFSPRPGYEIAFLGEEETQLELIMDDGESVETDRISIGFIAQTPLEELQERLKHNGYHGMSEILVPNPTIRFFYASDPDGFRVQFVENM